MKKVFLFSGIDLQNQLDNHFIYKGFVCPILTGTFFLRVNDVRWRINVPRRKKQLKFFL